MKSLEASLAALLEKIAPADLKLRLIKPSPKLLAALPSVGKRPTYALSHQTRSYDEGATGSSIRDIVEMALDGLDKGPKDVDRPVPSWYALSRMQREVVEQTLERFAAEHRASGARRNLLRDQAAHAEYELADAFRAALEALAFEPLNVPGSEWEPLGAGMEPATADALDSKPSKRRRAEPAKSPSDSTRRASRQVTSKRRPLK